MPDITAELLPKLRGHRLPGLLLGDEFVYPDYRGRSIVNLPGSICQLLGIPEFGIGPLAEEYLAPLGRDEAAPERVLLILMDALALERLQRWLARDQAPLWEQLADKGVLAPLTSIVPSTTAAALTSLWTGQPAAVHGIVGYEMWLKEYGLVANSISHMPMSFMGAPGSLAQAGFEPRKFMPLPTLGEHLQAHGVPAYAYLNYTIAGSGLSQMLFGGADLRSFGTATELWVNLRQLWEERAGERLFAWAYWGVVDHFSHIYGPDDERVEEEFRIFSEVFQRLFLEKLSAAAARGTVVVLCADHGQVATTPDPHYELRNHPSLTRRLHIMPTGENRLASLFARPGQLEAVREYLDRSWPRGFVQIDPAYAVDAGLFGPGAPHPRLSDRLGDLLALARGHNYLWWADKENPLIGRHGGLTPQEMLVPFLAARLNTP